MRYHVYIQCRVQSKRFPRKIFKKILGKSILEIIYSRLYKLGAVKVVSGDIEKNRELIPETNALNIECFFGDEDNLVKRFRKARDWFNTENIIRVTGDNPLTDPEIIRRAIKIFDYGHYDFLETTGYPKGVLFEIFRASKLDDIPDDMHLTEGLRGLDKKYIMTPEYPYNKNLNLEINYPEDYERVRKIFENFNNILVPFRYIASYF